MSDLMKREFDVLAPNGSNYLAWSLDAKILLAIKDLFRTIKPKDDKDKYTPAEQVVKIENTIEDYNTALYGITTRMKLCGLKLEDKDLIEKTLSTFHPKLTYISRQYKKDNYKKYVDLSNAMQQNQGEDETIMQNHLSRPTGTVATLEENATSFKNKKDIKGKGSQKILTEWLRKQITSRRRSGSQRRRLLKGLSMVNKTRSITGVECEDIGHAYARHQNTSLKCIKNFKAS
ncbi:hypothetical protein ACP70R_033639 [Stipagrostis hirtigluma subsp. patula]